MQAEMALDSGSCIGQKSGPMELFTIELRIVSNIVLTQPLNTA